LQIQHNFLALIQGTKLSPYSEMRGLNCVKCWAVIEPLSALPEFVLDESKGTDLPY